MKLLERIRAIFNFKGQRAEMELKSAEIRGDKVFLHPADDPNHTFCVSGKKIDILIDPAMELTEDDFMVLDNEKLAKLQPSMEIDPTSPIEKLLQPQTPPAEKQPPKPKEPSSPQQTLNDTSTQTVERKPDSKSDPKSDAQNSEKKGSSRAIYPNVTYTYQPPQMRTVSMRLYEDEYEMLMGNIEASGYRKTEFLLACVSAAKKKSMETNYQKYYADRERRRRERREAAKRAAEELEKQEKQVGA